MKSKVQIDGCVLAHLMSGSPLEKGYSPWSLLIGQSGPISGAQTTDAAESQETVTHVISVQSIVRIPKKLLKLNPKDNLKFMVENLNTNSMLLGLCKFVLQPGESMSAPSRMDYHYFDFLAKITPKANLNLLLSFISCQFDQHQWVFTMVHTSPLNQNQALEMEIFNLTHPKKAEERVSISKLTETLKSVSQNLQNHNHDPAHEALNLEIRNQIERLKKAQIDKKALLDEIDQIQRKLDVGEVSWENYLKKEST